MEFPRFLRKRAETAPASVKQMATLIVKNAMMGITYLNQRQKDRKHACRTNAYASMVWRRLPLAMVNISAARMGSMTAHLVQKGTISMKLAMPERRFAWLTFALARTECPLSPLETTGVCVRRMTMKIAPLATQVTSSVEPLTKDRKVVYPCNAIRVIFQAILNMM
jgi:hypothetical protein